MRSQANSRLTRHLVSEAQAVTRAIEDEQTEVTDSSLGRVAEGLLEEWPTRDLAYAVFDGGGVRLATGGNPALQSILPNNVPMGTAAVWHVPFGDEHSARLTVWPANGPATIRVVCAGSTMPMDEDLESLALALGLSVPLTIVLSVFGGYFLAGRSLQPVRELGARVAALDAEKLETRLPVSRSPDELDALAGQFNELLNRLAGARDVNRRFLRQAAHQIRTQLTLILGEATLSLERQRSPEYRIDTLQRIRLAAEQMWHRVDELFLLAQARAGERVDLTQDVELDGVALECTDLMRSRVTQTGHHLELAEVMPVVVRGNEALLREALLELLENACRYGEPGVPIQVRVTRDGAFAVISVSSAGPLVEPLPATSATGEPADEHGIGLQVVQWIAEQHGGELRMDRSDGLNHVRILVSTRKDP